MKFKKQLAGLKTVKEITTELYEFLVQNNIYEKLEQKIEELKQNNELEIAKQYELSIKILTDLFDEIVLVLGNKNITFDRYAKILKICDTERIYNEFNSFSSSLLYKVSVFGQSLD